MTSYMAKDQGNFGLSVHDTLKPFIIHSVNAEQTWIKCVIVGLDQESYTDLQVWAQPKAAVCLCVCVCVCAQCPELRPVRLKSSPWTARLLKCRGAPCCQSNQTGRSAVTRCTMLAWRTESRKACRASKTWCWTMSRWGHDPAAKYDRYSTLTCMHSYLW